VYKSIPPDPNAARVPQAGVSQHEAIGDIHFAADAFGNAVEAYRAALAAATAGAVPERVRLLLRIARAEMFRGRHDEAMASARDARQLSRGLGDVHLNAHVACGIAGVQVEQGWPRRALRYAAYAYRILRDTNDHDAVAQVSLTMGYALARSGQPQQAIDWLQSAAANYRRAETPTGL